MKYTVLLEEGEDGYIVAHVPALKGCHSQGKTREEALENARDAIRLYIEDLREQGEEIPRDVAAPEIRKVEVDA